MFRKKNLIAAKAKVGLVQMKGFFEIIFLYKYFTGEVLLAVLYTVCE